MRKLRQLSMAILLTLMLGTYALGGIIETPPAPEQSSASSSTAAVILSVIQVVLSVP